MKKRNQHTGAVKYITLFEEGTCGHKHRHYGKAVACLDRFEDDGIEAVIAAVSCPCDLPTIDHWLLKHTSKEKMKRVLEAKQEVIY